MLNITLKEWMKVRGIPESEEGAKRIAMNLAEHGHVAQPFFHQAFYAIKRSAQSTFAEEFHNTLYALTVKETTTVGNK
jgi:hypothetical protein